MSVQDNHKQYHRITEWFGLEETFKDHLVQPPCHGQARLSWDVVVKSPIQPDLETKNIKNMH